MKSIILQNNKITFTAVCLIVNPLIMYCWKKQTFFFCLLGKVVLSALRFLLYYTTITLQTPWSLWNKLKSNPGHLSQRSQHIFNSLHHLHDGSYPMKRLIVKCTSIFHKDLGELQEYYVILWKKSQTRAVDLPLTLRQNQFFFKINIYISYSYIKKGFQP